MVTFVAGGCGIVGSGVVSSLAQNGAKVWVAARNESRFDELRKTVPEQFHSNLAFQIADLANETDCLRLKDKILSTDGQLNHLVASMGGWRADGPLSTLTVENYLNGMKELTLPHFVVYRTFSKLLSETPNSSYIFITGGSGEAKFFDPKASLLPIKASAMYGMYVSACSEYKGNKNMALNELRLFFWIRRKPDSSFDPKKSQFEVGHDYVGKFIPKIILRHKSEVLKVQTRSVGDELFKKLSS